MLKHIFLLLVHPLSCLYIKSIKGKEVQPIIVKLNNLDAKEALIENAKRKNINGKDLRVGNYPIFLDEHLSTGRMVNTGTLGENTGHCHCFAPLLGIFERNLR